MKRGRPRSISRHHHVLHYTGTFLAYCCQLQTPVRVFMCTSEMCHYQVSQEPPQGAFSSQHAFPLAGYSFRRGSQYRKESGLIGMPPPTVPACVFFSAALLWAHGNVGSDTQLQQILTRGGPRKWDFFLWCVWRMNLLVWPSFINDNWNVRAEKRDVLLKCGWLMCDPHYFCYFCVLCDFQTELLPGEKI